METPADTLGDAREARARCTRLLTELHRLHLQMLNEARGLKRFTTAGRPTVEAETVAELLEQYMAASDSFLENMRGRMEGRLALIRRGEPRLDGREPDLAPGHGPFWLVFSRLCAALRRVERRVSG